MIVDLRNLVPSRIDHRDVLVKESENCLEIKCNKIKPPRPIMIKKNIEVNTAFFEVIGLYYGDGANAKESSGNRRIALANSCPELHEFWLSFLENFGIKREQMRAQVQIGSNVKLEHNDLINYWSRKTSIPIDNFCKINVKDVKTKKYGLLVSNFNSSIFRKIFDDIFDLSMKKCLENEKYSRAFLRGLFAAEGYVSINRNGSLATLDIPIKEAERRDYVKKLLVMNKVKFTETDKRILINGYLNFVKCDYFNLAGLHPDKIGKFKKGFSCLKSAKSVPALTKLKIISSLKEAPKNRYQIANEINKTPSLVHKLLRDLEIKKIVYRVNDVKTNSKKHIWSILQIPEDPFILTKNYYKTVNRTV